MTSSASGKHKTPLTALVAACLVSVLTSGVTGQTVEERPGQARSAGARTGNLEIEVGLVSQDGSVRRAARAQFRLVTRSVAALLMEKDPEGLSHFTVRGAGSDEDMEINTYCSLMRSPKFLELLKADQPRRVEASMAAEPSIRKNTVLTVQTDFDGKALFTNVPPGRYWVFGCYEVGAGSNRSSFNWNVPVLVVAGAKRSVILDQNNATGQ